MNLACYILLNVWYKCYLFSLFLSLVFCPIWQTYLTYYVSNKVRPSTVCQEHVETDRFAENLKHHTEKPNTTTASVCVCLESICATQTHSVWNLKKEKRSPPLCLGYPLTSSSYIVCDLSRRKGSLFARKRANSPVLKYWQKWVLN